MHSMKYVTHIIKVQSCLSRDIFDSCIRNRWVSALFVCALYIMCFGVNIQNRIWIMSAHANRQSSDEEKTIQAGNRLSD